MKYPLYIVDVFAEAKYEGNQLAVVLDEVGLETEMMQKIAREMHFSETTFITGYDLEKKTFKVRIFTPESELPFAGHPTLGTAYIAQKELLKEKVEELTLDMKAGLIPVKFNYEVPEDPEVYFHRIGRTARKGESGISITLVSEREEEYLFDIKQMTNTEMAEWPSSRG